MKSVGRLDGKKLAAVFIIGFPASPLAPLSLPIIDLFPQIGVTIVDDNQWEPDEEFFIKLSLVSGEGVKLGRTSIMEVTILNDDGEFEPRLSSVLLSTAFTRAGNFPVREEGTLGEGKLRRGNALCYKVK